MGIAMHYLCEQRFAYLRTDALRFSLPQMRALIPLHHLTLHRTVLNEIRALKVRAVRWRARSQANSALHVAVTYYASVN